ncbi:hypothetical protein Plhal703r1_c58g0163471 [Plasmopara halstedii]
MTLRNAGKLDSVGNETYMCRINLIQSKTKYFSINVDYHSKYGFLYCLTWTSSRM